MSWRTHRRGVTPGKSGMMDYQELSRDPGELCMKRFLGCAPQNRHFPGVPASQPIPAAAGGEFQAHLILGMGSGSGCAGAGAAAGAPSAFLGSSFLSQNPAQRCCGCSAPGWCWSLAGTGSCRRMNSPGSELPYSSTRISESLLLTPGCVSSVPFPPNTPFPTSNPCFQTTGRLRMRGKKIKGRK